MNRLLKWSILGVGALGLFGLFGLIFGHLFVAQPYRVQASSMAPTLLPGEHFLVWKLGYKPRRGDVVVFDYPPDPSVAYTKRIMGMPGDTIEVRDNVVWVNGESLGGKPGQKTTWQDSRCHSTPALTLSERHGDGEHTLLVNTGLSGSLANMRPVEVPPDSYLMLGDNRDFSEDGRRWGFVKRDAIRGQATRILFSWDACNGTARPGRRQPIH